MNTDNSTPETIAIPLTRGQFAIVDQIDADLSGVKWSAWYTTDLSGGNYYVRRSVKNPSGKYKTSQMMHRVIMERILGRPLVRGEVVDHKNHLPLDNRRENLRVATRSQNSMNTTRHKDNQSGFKGVSWDKRRGYWNAQIHVNGRNKYLGRYSTPHEAHEAYCEAARIYFGEFANLD